MKKVILGSIVVLLSASLAAADPGAGAFGDGGAALQGVLDGFTVAPVAGDSSVDVTADALADVLD